MQESLTPPQVKEVLDTTWLGRPYHYFQTVTSTNDLLKEQASAGVNSSNPAGTVLLSEYQEQGRGRMSRSWVAPAYSSLLFSILLRPGWPAERLSWLTMISGLAVSEAVEQQSNCTVRLKWPNDGVIAGDGIWLKYCGILLEGHIAPNNLLEYAVIGIGVNVNIPQEQLPETKFPATSLQVANGRPLSRLRLFSNILSRLEHHYELTEKGHSPHEMWQERLIFMNKRVVVSRFGQQADISGTAVGTDEEGRLLVRYDDGHIHPIAAGDVTLRAYLDPR